MEKMVAGISPAVKHYHQCFPAFIRVLRFHLKPFTMESSPQSGSVHRSLASQLDTPEAKKSRKEA
jgi:hypothetical protein